MENTLCSMKELHDEVPSYDALRVFHAVVSHGSLAQTPDHV